MPVRIAAEYIERAAHLAHARTIHVSCIAVIDKAFEIGLRRLERQVGLPTPTRRERGRREEARLLAPGSLPRLPTARGAGL
jgi:hypothetical protein